MKNGAIVSEDPNLLGGAAAASANCLQEFSYLPVPNDKEPKIATLFPDYIMTQIKQFPI